MSIKVENLTKLYGQQKALDNISFEITGNQVIGLIGPNGAGKSTLMKILTGFLSATSGKAVLMGWDVATCPLEVKKSIGYLPEHNPLYLEMYVREYLRYVAGIYKIVCAEDRIDEVIVKTGLAPEAGKRIGALSKGYRQRVGIAQAMLHNPQVLILDEPTSGLDPNQIAEIRHLVAEAGKSAIVILSTHIMQEVEAVCDRVILINKGRIVADGAPGGLQAGIKNTTRLVVRTEPMLNGEIAAKILDCQVAEVQNKLLLEGEDIKLLREKLMRYCLDNGIGIIEISEEKLSLEHFFREMTH